MEIASGLHSNRRLAQQSRTKRLDYRSQHRVVPADPHLEAIDLAPRRILFAQQIETGPTLRLIARQAAAAVGIVASRIVDRPAQGGQPPGGLRWGSKRTEEGRGGEEWGR